MRPRFAVAQPRLEATVMAVVGKHEVTCDETPGCAEGSVTHVVFDPRSALGRRQYDG
jgi:hypothetical protein